MNIVKRTLPRALALIFGILTLVGLLFAPVLGDLLLDWAAFLAAVALLLGVLNLAVVHGRRLAGGDGNSAVLVVGMASALLLALLDSLGLTSGGVQTLFELVQAPLEAAVAALLAFFLLFSGFRLLHRKRNWWSLLFLITAIIVLLGRTPMPEAISSTFGQLGEVIDVVIVGSGMRGILIGVSLGTIAVVLRVLSGVERPYDK